MKRYEKFCKYCGEAFLSYPSQRQKYCSKECADNSRKKKAILICEWCGRKKQVRYASEAKKLKYCSPKCQHEAASQKVTLVCKNCNIEFQKSPAFKNQIFCDINCKNEYTRKNSKYKKYEGHRKNNCKISKICKYCGKVYSVTPSLKKSKYCSKKCYHKYQKKHARLSGTEAIRKSIEYENWRTEIFERDNFTCAICGEVGGRLNAHHIKHVKNHPEFILDKNNGITLCYKCHRSVHSGKGGINDD